MRKPGLLAAAIVIGLVSALPVGWAAEEGGEPAISRRAERERALAGRRNGPDRAGEVEPIPAPRGETAEAAPEPEPEPEAEATAGDSDIVTQAELAEILVRVLGLARFLPAAPTPLENISVMLDNKISPVDGWRLGEPVRPPDLARVIVQAMKLQNEVEHPDDPMSWITYLQSIGVFPEDLMELTIGEVTDQLDPLAEPVAPNVFLVSVTTDPLKKHQKFAEPDEREYGTDLEFIPSERPVSFARPPEEMPPVRRRGVRRVIRLATFRPRRLPPATPF